MMAYRVAEKSPPGKRHVIVVDEQGACFAKLTLGPDQQLMSPLCAELPKLKIHAYARSEGICAIAITDEEYPNLSCTKLLSQIADEFTSKYPRTAYANLRNPDDKTKGTLSYPELAGHLAKWQRPEEVDNMTKIQRELDETKEVLQETIQSVMNRGEKLDDMVAKSDNLSATSKMFYTQAKKQNSCCVVM
jgi:synaptobrevin family protein YKT6